MIFIVTSSIIVVLVYLYWPETARIPLEQVAAVFGDTDVASYDLGHGDKPSLKEVE
jgi:hypothetical protein